MNGKRARQERRSRGWEDAPVVCRDLTWFRVTPLLRVIARPYEQGEIVRGSIVHAGDEAVRPDDPRVRLHPDEWAVIAVPSPQGLWGFDGVDYGRRLTLRTEARAAFEETLGWFRELEGPEVQGFFNLPHEYDAGAGAAESEGDATRYQVFAMIRVESGAVAPGPCKGMVCRGRFDGKRRRAKLLKYVPDLRTFPIHTGEDSMQYSDRVWQFTSDAQAQGIFTTYQEIVCCPACAAEALATLMGHSEAVGEYEHEDIAQQVKAFATFADIFSDGDIRMAYTVVMTAEPGPTGTHAPTMVHTPASVLVQRIVDAQRARARVGDAFQSVGFRFAPHLDDQTGA
jgi:hypothetical protein